MYAHTIAEVQKELTENHWLYTHYIHLIKYAGVITQHYIEKHYFSTKQNTSHERGVKHQSISQICRKTIYTVNTGFQ